MVSCSPDNQQGGFLREWLNSHLEAAETIGKPLLFEEFGKKLDNPGGLGVWWSEFCWLGSCYVHVLEPRQAYIHG